MTSNRTPQVRDEAQLGGIVLSAELSLQVTTDFYSPSPDDLAFLKAAIGIDDDNALKAHIVMVKERACKVAPYPCIYGYRFVNTPITMQLIYMDILRIGHEREDAIFLDIGCGLGAESRKFASDGFPPHKMITSDLVKGDLTYVLFRTTKETFPANFIAGDVFDSRFLALAPPAREPVQDPMPDLSALTSLNPLHGLCSVINAAALFHLFNEEQKLYLACDLAGLLSAIPGSIICGINVGTQDKGARTTDLRYPLFPNSMKTWMDLWYGNVFQKEEAEVRVERRESVFMGETVSLLLWYVKRL